MELTFVFYVHPGHKSGAAFVWFRSPHWCQKRDTERMEEELCDWGRDAGA